MAMSAVGNVPSRFPATPSNTVSPLTGSVSPAGVNREISSGRVNVWPSSNDLACRTAGCLFTLPSQNTYTTPLLLVRIQQSCRPPVWLLLVAALSWRCVHVVPPSVDRARMIGSGRPCFSWLRNAA